MQMKVEININAPAEEAWKVLGEGFGSISEWTSSLKSSSLAGGLAVGGVRTCEDSKGFGPFKPGIVQERLVDYDPSAMTFEYEAISGLPGMVRKAANRWSVHKVDEENCIVRSVATLEFRGIFKLLAPLMRVLLKSEVNKFKEELHYRIVHGHPHPNACSLSGQNKPVTE